FPDFGPSSYSYDGHVVFDGEAFTLFWSHSVALLRPAYDLTPPELLAMRVSRSGVPLGAPVPVARSVSDSVALAPIAVGKIAVAWIEYTPGERSIRGTIFTGTADPPSHLW